MADYIPTDADRREAEAYRARAYEALSDARYLLDDGRALAAAGRTYYAAFYAVTAAVLLEGERPKTHKGLRLLFQQHCVTTGRVRPQYAQVFDAAREVRENADYDALSDYDTHAVEGLYDDVILLVHEIDEALGWEPRYDV